MLKDFLQYLFRKIILPGCGFFTLFLFLLTLTSSFFEPEKTPAILLSQAMVILLFSFVLSALNRILSIGSLHSFVRVGIHFLSSTAALVLIMMLLSGFYSANGINSTLFLTIVYVVLYAVTALILLLLRAFGVNILKEQASPSKKKSK